MNDILKDRLFSVLVESAGASPQLKDEFMAQFPDCEEFRFQGDLGSGGKIWNSSPSPRVSCYSEDLTPDRKEIIALTNIRLSLMVDVYSSW